MANTKYRIKQTVNIGGDLKSNTFDVLCSATEISSFLAELEGEYEVWTRDDNLTGGSDTELTAWNGIDQISFKGKDSNGNFLFSRIKPFKGLIYAKNSTTSDVIQGIFATSNPFPSFPTVKPTTVKTSTDEIVGAVAP